MKNEEFKMLWANGRNLAGQLFAFFIRLKVDFKLLIFLHIEITLRKLNTSAWIQTDSVI